MTATQTPRSHSLRTITPAPNTAPPISGAQKENPVSASSVDNRGNSPSAMHRSALQEERTADSIAAASFSSDSAARQTFPETVVPGDSVAPTPLYRIAEPRDIFGSASTRAAEITVPVPEPLPQRVLSDTPYFETLVLLLAAVYAIFLYRHINDIVLLIRHVFRSRTSHERLVDLSGGSNNILRFLDIAAAIGVIFLGAAITRYADTRLPAEQTAAWPREAIAAASLLVAALWSAIAAYQSLLLKTVGAVTLTLPLMDQIWLLKRTYFALTAIVATPTFLLLTLSSSDAGMSWFYITVAESAIAAILCLRETSQLFLAKKIPILYWFLYLCIVEIFPFSLLWLIATR